MKNRILLVIALFAAFNANADPIDQSAKLLSQGCKKIGVDSKECKVLIEDVLNAAVRPFTEFPKILPNRNGEWIMPLIYDPKQKSRVSHNFGPLDRGFNHLVKVDFRNVRVDDLPKLKFTFMADKQARNDKPRSAAFRDGEEVFVHGATSRDRGYYIARLNYPDGREAFFLKNPRAEIVITPIDKWQK